ncbi:MAG: S16 family serine protease, partial [Candidatus Kapaibacteriota bacterium]
ILPIGGLNEKLLAAKRAGTTTVLIPEGNRTDVQELDAGVTDGLTIVFVSSIEEALPIAVHRKTPRSRATSK